MKYLLGLDIGSSSVKACLLDADSGKVVASAQSPSAEMRIDPPQPGFAEQDPDMWWAEMINAIREVRRQVDFGKEPLGGIGISYQMHGLVSLDKEGTPLHHLVRRPRRANRGHRFRRTGRRILPLAFPQFPRQFHRLETEMGKRS
jgi:sugar (pentulose or hexulose) kinase